MTFKKVSLFILLLTLTFGLAALQPQTTPNKVTAQEDEKIYLPFFSHSHEPLASTSYYMITVDPEFTYSLGCELGTRDKNEPGAQDNVVVLDYSNPEYTVGTGFGATIFGFGPVGLSKIRISAENFAKGYYNCTGSDNESNLVLGVGTNNKPTTLDTAEKMTEHGAVWARMVNTLNQTLLEDNMLQQVQAYGANDIELGWNSPTNSIAWLTGYGCLAEAPMIHYGDAAGCPYEEVPGMECGTSAFPEWTQEDVWYVSWGFEPSLPLPLIYLTNGVHAKQWAYLSQYAVANHGTRMDFTGVFTQSQACEQWNTCNGTDNTPSEAYWQLYEELNKYPETAQDLDWKTDIRWILREEAYPELYREAAEATPSLPPSMAGWIESLTQAEASPNTSREAQSLISGKLALLNGLAEKMQLSGANPAPKGTGLSASAQAASEPSFVEGLIPNGTIAGLPYGAEITTVWQALTDTGYLQVAAGASAGHPGRGALFILRTSADKTASASTLLVTEEENGSLLILEETENGLLLQSARGALYELMLGPDVLILLD
jgi:hypothetical protein